MRVTGYLPIHKCTLLPYTAYPSITVPAGYAESGEPVGITFSAGAYSEGVLLKIAYAYEQATKLRKAPSL